MWLSNQLGQQATIAAGNASLFDLFQGMTAGTVRQGLTVVRMLLKLEVGPNTVGEIVQYQIAVMVAEADAVAAGALPEPGTDILNYYLHDGGSIRTDVDAGPPQRTETYDIRTARKIPSQAHTLVFIIENTDAVNSLTFGLFSRLLIKLP